MTPRRRTRVVVAGQTPPPPSGMHVVVRMALDQLRRDPDLDVAHLRFRFSERMEDLHRPAVRKVAEVLRVVGRQIRLRTRGPIDVTLYPVGGPSVSSTARDLMVLPIILLCSRRTVLHFHGAGHASAWVQRRLWMRLAAWLYRRCSRALVMTEFNRCDPEALGIDDVVVAPHRITDEFAGRARRDNQGPVRFLYVGHLGPQRRTDELIAAFGIAAGDDPDVELHIVGRPVAPYRDSDLDDAIARSGVGDRIDVDTLLTGDGKWNAFDAASWFVFPSVFECESFGLVLAEAMMFGLPVIATDWRGNLDVVDATCDREVVDPDVDRFVPRLADAMARAAQRTRSGLTFSEANRARSLERYCDPSKWDLRAGLVDPAP